MKELSIKEQKSLTGGNHFLDPCAAVIGGWIERIVIGLVGISKGAW